MLAPSSGSTTPRSASRTCSAVTIEPPPRPSRRCAGAHATSWPADAHPPDLRPLLEIRPGELPRLLRLELVVERLGIVIVDEDERLPRTERLKRREDDRVTPGGRQRPDVEVGLRVCGRPLPGRLVHLRDDALLFGLRRVLSQDRHVHLLFLLQM